MSEPKYLTIEHLSTKDITRIFSKIKVNSITECWEWQGKLSHKGTSYGCVWWQGKEERAHRLMYAWLVEPIPIGISANIPNIDHECNNKQCCNPAHLTLKPQRDNTLRSQFAHAAINARKTHCPEGHEYSQAGTARQQRRRICLICHKDKAAKYRRIPEVCARASEYHRNRRKDPEILKRHREAMRRYRERLKSNA